MSRSTNPFLPQNTAESPYVSHFKRNFANFEEGRADYLSNLGATRGSNSLTSSDQRGQIRDVSGSPIFKDTRRQKVLVEGFSPLTGAPQEPIPNANDLVLGPPQESGFTPDFSSRRMQFLNSEHGLQTKSVVETDIRSLPTDPSVYGTQNYTPDLLDRSKYIVDSTDRLGGYFPYGNESVGEIVFEHAPRVRPRTMKERRVEWDMKQIVGERFAPVDSIIDSRQEQWDPVPNYKTNNKKAVYNFDMFQKENSGNHYLHQPDAGPVRHRPNNRTAIDNYTRMGNHIHTYKPVPHGRHIQGPKDTLDVGPFYLGNGGNLVNSLAADPKQRYLKQGRVNPTFYIGNAEALVKESGHIGRGDYVRGQDNKTVFSRNPGLGLNQNTEYRSQEYTTAPSNKIYASRELMGGTLLQQGNSHSFAAGDALNNRTNGVYENKRLQF